MDAKNPMREIIKGSGVGFFCCVFSLLVLYIGGTLFNEGVMAAGETPPGNFGFALCGFLVAINLTLLVFRVFRDKCFYFSMGMVASILISIFCYGVYIAVFP